jgi:hypothetical protein
LPSNMVESYIQPWDPVVRLFSECDPLYPLIGEIDMENGDDGQVLYPRGPPRILRPVTSAIIEAWGEGWPEFRDEFYKNSNQTYAAIGVQHIILPEPTRYLSDRFLSVDIAVPPAQTILRLSSQDLFPALTKAFPLDTFEISYLPQAIRSFVHHFWPAYRTPMAGYAKRLRREKAKLDAKQGVELTDDTTEVQQLEDEDDGPCLILDPRNEEDASVLISAIQKGNLPKTTAATALSVVATAPNEGSASTKQMRFQRRRPWTHATQWLRRKDDLAP